MRRIPALLLLALAVVVGFAAPASAHTEMVQTSPAAGATEAAGDRAVTLTFTQKVDHRLANVTVRRATGAVVSTGQPQREGLALVQPVTALTPARYGVEWRAAAADGHILEGTFSFRVAADTAAAPTSSTEETERLSPADLLREHAKGNYDHDAAPSYAASTDDPAADSDDAPAADPATGVDEPPPAPDNSTTAIVTLLAVALAVTAITAGVESIRAHRV